MRPLDVQPRQVRGFVNKPPDAWAPVTGPRDWVRHDQRTGRATLLGGWSPSSGRHHFPRAALCPFSGADDVETVELSRLGSLWAWTAVTAAPPGYDGPVPYGFGVVELAEERLRVVGRLTVADPAMLSYGQPMEVVGEELTGVGAVWAFASAPAPASDGGRVDW